MTSINSKNGISQQQADQLLVTLQERFEKNMPRHAGVDWRIIQTRLVNNTDKLLSLYQMETTGGEPDVVGYDQGKDVYIFCDCSAESPAGRRSLCYDQEALESRKEHKPAGSAIGMASAMGVEILTEQQYRELQMIGVFDRKTSSWVKTPARIRALGGAIFCDRRYDTVFVYHNGAESYYSSRGFRGSLSV